MSLDQISTTTKLTALTTAQVKELQELLNRHGADLVPDGIFGVLTTNAFEKFKKDNYLSQLDSIGPSTIRKLKAKPSQYSFRTKEGTVDAIITECKKQGLNLKQQIAYVIATTEWETARTFKPVREAYWMSETWRQNNLRYYPYYG